MKSNGSTVIKVENDEILRLQKQHNMTPQEIRNTINKSMEEFKPLEEWR